MTICCISGCKNVGSHRFPKDQRLRSAWVERILAQVKQHPDWVITSSSRLCSNHFQPDDFVHEGFHSGLKLQKRVLKPYAVPTVFQSSASLQSSIRRRRHPPCKTRPRGSSDLQNRSEPNGWSQATPDSNRLLSAESSEPSLIRHKDAPILWCALQNLDCTEPYERRGRSSIAGIGPSIRLKPETATGDGPLSHSSSPSSGPTIVDIYHMPMSIFEEMDSGSPEWMEQLLTPSS